MDRDEVVTYQVGYGQFTVSLNPDGTPCQTRLPVVEAVAQAVWLGTYADTAGITTQVVADDGTVVTYDHLRPEVQDEVRWRIREIGEDHDRLHPRKEVT